MDYGFTHLGKVFTPNGTADVSPADNEARNKAIEQAELARWQAQPEHMLAYYMFPAEHTKPHNRYRGTFSPLLTGATVTTWTGAHLGTIVDARVYLHNFGGRMISLHVTGSNGASYYGRASYDWGQCINLRKVKG